MKYFVILSLCLFFQSSVSAYPANEYQNKIDNLINAYEQVYGFSGTVKVVKNNEEVFEKSFGLANREYGVKNDPSHRVSINSISKTFTALAVLILANKKKLELHEPISKIDPSLKASWADQITLHHLLSHTSGLPRESGVQFYHELTLKEQVDQFVSREELLFKPGERYEYSNSGMILTGYLIEAATGKEFAEFIQENIIDPMGLGNTGLYKGRKVVKNQAIPYKIGINGIEFAQRAKHFGENAGGGMYSTASDLYQFIKKIESNLLIPEELTKLLFTSHFKSESGDEGYAWSIKQIGGQKVYLAAGSGYGTKSVILRSPNNGDYIAITSNWGNFPIFKLLKAIYFLLNNDSYDTPKSELMANPKNFKEYLGTYVFISDELRKHLGFQKSQLSFKRIDSKVYLEDEVLEVKSSKVLGFTYTDELLISFKKNTMLIEINGKTIVGKKISIN